MPVSAMHVHDTQAHAATSSLAWGIILPLGAILIRLVPSKRAWIVHAGIMVLGLILFTAGFGTGLWAIFDYKGKVGNVPHAIVGVTVFALAWLQPLTGLSHHWHYRTTRKRTFMSALHVFIGRVLILLGIVNGGIGFTVNPKDNNLTQQVVYGVLSGTIAFAYLAASFYFESKRDNDIRGAPATTPSERGSLSSKPSEERLEKI